MQGIEVTLLRNKQFIAQNSEDYKVIGNENNATTIIVHFPDEYENYSKRVDFKNIRNEKWTIGLYTPEDETITYGSDFDKKNFAFTLPNQVTIKGELKIQFVAYLPDETQTLVPFELLKIDIKDDILYARKEASDSPDLILKAYEYSNMALELSREAVTRAEDAERAALESEKSAKAAENSALQAQQSASEAQASAKSANERATNAETSALAAENSALESENSAKNAENSAKYAESVSNTANANSEYAVKTADEANEKSTLTLDIVENLTVSSTEIDCREHVNVEMQTDEETQRKNIHFNVPAPKQGKSYRSRGAWDETQEYINDEYYIDTVSDHGCTYLCKQTNTKQRPLPSEENEYWGLLAVKGSDAGVTIVDTLESSHADYVLSANQGRVLKELIASSIETAITNLINNAPDDLNTLKELADAIDNDANFGTTIKALISKNAQDISWLRTGQYTAGMATFADKVLLKSTYNQAMAPSWYTSTYADSLLCELKKVSMMKLEDFMSGEFCHVLTFTSDISITNTYPFQVAFGNGAICYRSGTFNSEWGSWRIVVSSHSASTLGDITVSSIDIVTT